MCPSCCLEKGGCTQQNSTLIPTPLNKIDTNVDHPSTDDKEKILFTSLQQAMKYITEITKKREQEIEMEIAKKFNPEIEILTNKKRRLEKEIKERDQLNSELASRLDRTKAFTDDFKERMSQVQDILKSESKYVRHEKIVESKKIEDQNKKIDNECCLCMDMNKSILPCTFVTFNCAHWTCRICYDGMLKIASDDEKILLCHMCNREITKVTETTLLE
jgi:hypothetical protein